MLTDLCGFCAAEWWSWLEMWPQTCAPSPTPISLWQRQRSGMEWVGRGRHVATSRLWPCWSSMRFTCWVGFWLDWTFTETLCCVCLVDWALTVFLFEQVEALWKIWCKGWLSVDCLPGQTTYWRVLQLMSKIWCWGWLSVDCLPVLTPWGDVQDLRLGLTVFLF